MTRRWMHLKVKGSIPAGRSELPDGRSRSAPGRQLPGDSIVPPVPAQEPPLRCKGALAGSPLPEHPAVGAF